MIFVTVGTHEQPFNRLIQKIDELKDVAKRRLLRYANNSPLQDLYNDLIEKIESDKYKKL